MAAAGGAKRVEHARLDGMFAGKDIRDQPRDVGQCGVVPPRGGQKRGINVHGNDFTLCRTLGEQAREVADTRADFENHILGDNLARIRNRAENRGIHHEILPEVMPRPKTGGAEHLVDFLSFHRGGQRVQFVNGESQMAGETLSPRAGIDHRVC